MGVCLPINPNTAQRGLLLLAAIVGVCSPTSPAYGDTVTLINGDRFTGKLLYREGKNLHFKTEYAGKIKVNWEHIRSLETEKPAVLKFDNGEKKRVVFVEVREQEVVYRDADDEKLHSLDVESIDGLSPETWIHNEKGYWKGFVNLSIKSDRGNGDADFLDLDADVSYERRIDRWHLYGEWEYDRKVEQRNTYVTKDKWLLESAYNYFYSEGLYTGVMVMLEHDILSDLNHRFATGPVFGHEVYKSKKLNLKAEIGLLWLDEDYRNAPDNNDILPGWRLEFDKYIFNDTFQFYHRETGVVPIDSTTNWYFKAWTGLRIPVDKGLQAGVEYKLEYDNNPPEPNDTTESTIRLKLGYKW